ncbi:MAG: PH domain-containing protein [Patescibacteria group bacterium]
MDPLYQLLQLGLTERVILYLRRHWFVFLKKLLTFIIEAIVPVLIYLGLINFAPDIFSNQSLMVILVLAVSLYYLFIWVILFYNWLDYYLDIWVITDKQVINVYQNGLWNRAVARQPLANIQDVMAEEKGIWPTLFHFGNIKIQTAGSEGHFILSEIPNVFEVAAKINDLVKYAPKDGLKK